MFSHRKNQCGNIHPLAALFFVAGAAPPNFRGKSVGVCFRTAKTNEKAYAHQSQTTINNKNIWPRAGVCFHICFCGAKTYSHKPPDLFIGPSRKF